MLFLKIQGQRWPLHNYWLSSRLNKYSNTLSIKIASHLKQWFHYLVRLGNDSRTFLKASLLLHIIIIEFGFNLAFSAPIFFKQGEREMSFLSILQPIESEPIKFDLIKWDNAGLLARIRSNRTFSAFIYAIQNKIYFKLRAKRYNMLDVSLLLLS
jgi:hypothetical protein